MICLRRAVVATALWAVFLGGKDGAAMNRPQAGGYSFFSNADVEDRLRIFSADGSTRMLPTKHTKNTNGKEPVGKLLRLFVCLVGKTFFEPGPRGPARFRLRTTKAAKPKTIYHGSRR